MTTAVTIDLAGGQLGGAARYRDRAAAATWSGAPRDDVRVIGTRRDLTPAWLAAREASAVRRGRRVALNNVGFLTPGGERWTLLANALHFLTGAELAALDPGLRAAVSRQTRVVHRGGPAIRRPRRALHGDGGADHGRAARGRGPRGRAHAPGVRHSRIPRPPGGSLILCPVLFAPYKHMPDRIARMARRGRPRAGRLGAPDRHRERRRGARVAGGQPAAALRGRLSVDADCGGCGRAAGPIYFPTGLESFGCPLAEARVNGRPVIARDTPQNREIAGPALCGYDLGDADSLRRATEAALTLRVAPDPEPFDPDAYFDWMLGDSK